MIFVVSVQTLSSLKSIDATLSVKRCPYVEERATVLKLPAFLVCRVPALGRARVVCVCVCERERETESEGRVVWAVLGTWRSVCMCVCV